MLLWSFVYKFFVNLCLHFTWNRSGIAGSYGREMPNSFAKQLYHFTFPPAMYEGFNCSTSSSALIICLFDYSHPSGVRSGISLVLIWITLMANDAWASFHVPIGHWFTFFREMCIWILKSFEWLIPITLLFLVHGFREQEVFLECIYGDIKEKSVVPMVIS